MASTILISWPENEIPRAWWPVGSVYSDESDSQENAVPRTTMATYAIGDVHGNIRALEDLLAVLNEELSAADTVVFLGDIIDRGPDSRECISRILEFKKRCSAKVVALLGNHEQWMLETYRNPARHSWILGMEGLSTIRSYSEEVAVQIETALDELGPRVITERVSLPYQLFFDSVPSEHMAFLSDLSAYYRTPEAVCVHGGLDPRQGRVEEQKLECLVWGSEGFPDNYQGTDRVMYGHADDPVIDGAGWPHPRIVGRTYGLDTISAGVLTALRLPDGAVFQSRRWV